MAFVDDVAVNTCPELGAVALFMVTVPVAVLRLSPVIVFVVLSRFYWLKFDGHSNTQACKTQRELFIHALFLLSVLIIGIVAS